MISQLPILAAWLAVPLSAGNVDRPHAVPPTPIQEPCSAAIAVLDRSRDPGEVQWALRSLNGCPKQASTALVQLWASAPADPTTLVALVMATSRVRSGALLQELERTLRGHDSVIVRGAALGAAVAMVTRRGHTGFERTPSGTLQVNFVPSVKRIPQGSADPLPADAGRWLAAVLDSRATTEPDHHTRLLIALMLREVHR